MSFSSFSYFTFCRTKCASELHFFPHSPPPLPPSSAIYYGYYSMGRRAMPTPPSSLPPMPILPPPQPCEQRQSQCKCRLPLTKKERRKRIMRPHFFCKGTCTIPALKKNRMGTLPPIFANHFRKGESGAFSTLFCHARTHCCLAH